PVRQEVQAGRISAREGKTPRLVPARDEAVEARPGHAAERADGAALRAYRAAVEGRTATIVRGGLHPHTELSRGEGGANDGSLEDLYRYMIDAAALDFGAATDHQGGAWPYWWYYNLKLTDMYHVPGAYVPLFAYERSASYPFGHRNLVFARRGAAR